MKIKKILLVALSLMLLLAFGCSKDTNNSSVTNPNPDNLMPKGTVQGILKDTCTNEPIKGAIIDIGVATATTNDRGQYVMRNVPATTYVSPSNRKQGDQVDGFSGYYGNYSVTIDMRKAKNTVTGINNYPQFAYDEVEVIFSSMEESKGSDTEVDVTVDSSNHDTPVTGLGTGDQDFYVGQVKTGISGQAAYENMQPVPAGYIVRLYSMGSNWDGDTTTGDSGHLIWTTTTDANGKFAFTAATGMPLEASMRYKIEVIDTDIDVPTFRGTEYSQARTPCEGIKYFGIQDGDPVTVYSSDVVCPFVVANTPIQWEDLSADVTGGINVTFTFSEPIVATVHNTVQGLTPSDLGGLYYDISVYYNGNKGAKYGNIPHTLSWNDTMTVLTVNIPMEAVAPSAVYEVEIENNRNLRDASGNPLADPPGPDYYEYHGSSCSGSCCFSKYEINFTTYGAPSAAASVLSVRNAAELDFDSNVDLSWSPALGAVSYNLYCQVIQWNSTTGAVHPYFLVGNTDLAIWYLNPEDAFDDVISNITDDFVEDWKIKLSYNCYVRGVNSDGLEGDASNVVNMSDVIAPEARSSSGSIPDSCESSTFTTFRVYFNEYMDKATVENVMNWTINPLALATAATISKVEYYSNPNSYYTYALITMSAETSTISCTVAATVEQADDGLCGDPAPDVTFLTAGTGLKDVAGNALEPFSAVISGLTYGGPNCD